MSRDNDAIKMLPKRIESNRGMSALFTQNPMKVERIVCPVCDGLGSVNVRDRTMMRCNFCGGMRVIDQLIQYRQIQD